ncbi:hypothetical protein AB0L26_11620 [Streptomyces nondiastaticus]|uniref:hypothetical protein n=1 Tax=Streptomyces nondiastaticus TaxID=3154512 RepID=UPI00342C0EB0
MLLLVTGFRAVRRTCSGAERKDAAIGTRWLCGRGWADMGGRFSWSRRLGCVVAALLAVLVHAAPDASAHASRAAVTVSCAGSNTISFSPGLSLTAQRTRIGGSGAYSCLSTDPALRSGTSSISGGGWNGCFFSDATTAEWITWNTGEQTKVVYHLGNVQQVAGQAVVLIVGRVVKGKFKGRTVASPGLQVALDPLKCASKGGVELINGPSTLVIV